MLRLKDEQLKEKDSLLRTLHSQDTNSVTLARRNQAQKAKLRNKVMIPPFFLPPLLVSFQDEIIKMRDREIAILRETMAHETESKDEEPGNKDGKEGSSTAS